MNDSDLTRGQTVYREFIDTFYYATRSPWQHLLPSNHDVYNLQSFMQPMQSINQATDAPEFVQSMAVRRGIDAPSSHLDASAVGEVVSVVTCEVEQQYTMPKKDSDQLSDRKKLKLVQWRVRFVKDQKSYPDGSSPLFVIANDIGPLVHIRSGHVPANVSQYDHHLKRTILLPPKKSGRPLPQVVLSMDGLKKLALSRRLFEGQVEAMLQQHMQQET